MRKQMHMNIHLYKYVYWGSVFVAILAQDLPRSCVQTEAVGELTVSGLK